uniref:Uncharacterized protein n=1 Tax=Anguilla anguilla TaxID=7936 RepID=A0A0E9XT97_ANGAN
MYNCSLKCTGLIWPRNQRVEEGVVFTMLLMYKIYTFAKKRRKKS